MIPSVTRRDPPRRPVVVAQSRGRPRRREVGVETHGPLEHGRSPRSLGSAVARRAACCADRGRRPRRSSAWSRPPAAPVAPPEQREEALPQAGGDLFAQADEVAGRGARRVAPQEAIAVGVDDLERHAQLVALLLEVAGQDVGDLQLASGGLRVHVPFRVLLRGREGADRERGDVGERRRDLVRQRQPQVVGRGVAAEVLEGEDGDRRLAAGRGRGASGRCDGPPGAAAGGDEDGGRAEGQRPPRPIPRCGGGGAGAAARLAAPGRVRVALQALQVRLQLRGALVAQVPVLLEGGVDDALELGGQLRVQAVTGETGARFRIASKMIADVLPAKGCRPVAIS